jgi:hypothetical protein
MLTFVYFLSLSLSLGRSHSITMVVTVRFCAPLQCLSCTFLIRDALQPGGCPAWEYPTMQFPLYTYECKQLGRARNL